jgi:hypothetical protein
MKTTIQTVPQSVPYIRASADRARHWAQRLSVNQNGKIGITWAGRPEHPNDRRRSIPVDQLRALGNVPNVTFVTIQPRPADAPAPAGIPLLDFGPELTDFADTAGLMSQLKLIITVDTSVAHLAGAMGRATWLLLPFSPDWRWLMQREESPWYPTMRIFRQTKLGDWGEMIGRVVSELLREVPTNARL